MNQLHHDKLVREKPDLLVVIGPNKEKPLGGYSHLRVGHGRTVNFENKSYSSSF